MKITDIKQQVKRKDRYSVYVDSKYSFSLSENELINQGLRIGQEFDKQTFEEVKKTAEEDKAYMRAIDLLSRRQRSTWEMQQYLKRKGYDNKTIQKILNVLSNKTLLNDRTFAEAWVANRRLLKQTSRRRLWQELKQKHVRDEIITEVLEEDDTDERQVLMDLVAKKRQQTRYQDAQKLMAYLLRQGFNYGDIRQVLDVFEP